ncbi:hypothetical protein [Daejeonella sp.]|nr:hypothetical protein [Daejeonella sp.]MDO8994946.1 hypothetical protein [Daejeonella sp.]MDP2413320.1 hypothetical protein [Daejeonella sp.]
MIGSTVWHPIDMHQTEIIGAKYMIERESHEPVLRMEGIKKTSALSWI